MCPLPKDAILDKMEELLNVASDSTRLKILYVLTEGEKNVTEIVEGVGASQSLVSHQLQVLRKSGLVATRKDGHRVFYRLDDDHVNRLLNVVYEHASEKVK